MGDCSTPGAVKMTTPEGSSDGSRAKGTWRPTGRERWPRSASRHERSLSSPWENRAHMGSRCMVPAAEIPRRTFVRLCLLSKQNTFTVLKSGH